MRKSNSSTQGVGFTGLLTLVFIVLKLTKSIDWSWLWVLSPIWIMIIIATLAILAYVYVNWYEDKKDERVKQKINNMDKTRGGK